MGSCLGSHDQELLGPYKDLIVCAHFWSILIECGASLLYHLFNYLLHVLTPVYNRTPPLQNSDDSESEWAAEAARQLEEDAWDILRDFATSDSMTLPEAQEALQDVLGNAYVAAEWKDALDAVLNAEKNHDKALEAVEALAAIPFVMPDLVYASGSTSATPQHSTAPALSQLSELESALMESIHTLQDRIPDLHMPTLEELLDPPAERENADSQMFPGGEKDIVALVQHEMAVARGEIVEVEDVEDDGSDLGEDLSRAEKMQLILHSVAEVQFSPVQ